MEQFGEMLRRYRRALGLTQEALAVRATLSVQAVGALERGDRRFPHQDTVTRLADALELGGEPRAAFIGAAATRRGVLRPADRSDQLEAMDRFLAQTSPAADRSKDDAEPTPVPQINQLPSDVPDFTGRDEQLRRVLKDLGERATDGPVPVVVLFGGPGVGKSTLAVHAARAVIPDFPDGQFYLDLAGTSARPREPEVLLAELLHALGVVGGAIPDGEAARATLFRSLLARRRMLLMLDDAGHSEQVRPLLPPHGGCAVLITSRRLLTDIAGARHIELDVLGEREALRLFNRIVGAERVASEPDQAAAILRACGHLPLAIRIAAGRALGRPTWPLRLLRDRLDDETKRLNELQLGELEVRASFEASVRQLADDTVRAFRLLGLLGPRTFPGWVAGPLLDRPHADDVLDTLVDANLVRLSGIDINGYPRYRLHDLLRAYADEGAAAIPEPQRRDAVRRLLGAWLDLAVRAVDRLPPSLFTPPRGNTPRQRLPESTVDRLIVDAGSWFEAERAGLLGAVELAVSWRMDEAAWEIAAAAVPFYDQHSYYEDWRRTHTLAIEVVCAAGNQRGEAVMRRGLAQVHVYRDEYDVAAEGFRRARELSQLTGDKREEFLASSGLGTIDRVQGRYDLSETHIRDALDIMVAVGDQPLETQLRSALGVVLLAQGKTDEARASFEESLRMCGKLGDIHREGVVLRQASLLYDRIGDTERTFAHLQRALEIFQGLDDERCVAYTLLRTGEIHSAHQDRPRATVVLQRAAAYFAKNGNRLEEAQCWQLLGELDAEQQDPASARQHLTRALQNWRSIGAADEVAKAEAILHRLGEPGS